MCYKICPNISYLQLIVLLPLLEMINCQTCSDCSQTDDIYACVDEFKYGICFGLGTVYPSAIESCPDGYYCNVGGTFCTPMETSSVSSLEIINVCNA